MKRNTKNSTNSANTQYSDSGRIVRSPRGKEYIVENISAFARKHKLDRSSLSRVVNGVRQSHRDWTLVA